MTSRIYVDNKFAFSDLVGRSEASPERLATNTITWLGTENMTIRKAILIEYNSGMKYLSTGEPISLDELRKETSK